MVRFYHRSYSWFTDCKKQSFCCILTWQRGKSSLFLPVRALILAKGAEALWPYHPQRPHLLIPLSRVLEFQYNFEGGTEPAVWETWV